MDEPYSCCSVPQFCLTLCDPVDYDMPGSLPFTLYQSLLTLMCIGSMMPFNHLVLCQTLLFLHSIFPSTWVFSNESVLCSRWPKYSSFSFCISPLKEYSGLISFRIDWFDLLAVQGILKSLLQHHSLKTWILQCSAFFMVQLSYPYMTTGKAIALTIWTFVSKVMSVLFNMLSRFVMAFLPRSKHLLISWLRSQYAVILEAKTIMSVTVSIVSHLLALKIWEQMPWSKFLLMLRFKPAFSFCSFKFIKRLFSSSLLLAIRVVSLAYLRLLILLLTLLIPACTSSSPAFHMMYSV